MQKINTSIQRKAIETNNITGWQAQQAFCFDYILADSTAVVFRKSKKQLLSAFAMKQFKQFSVWDIIEINFKSKGKYVLIWAKNLLMSKQILCVNPMTAAVPQTLCFGCSCLEFFLEVVLY